MASESEQVAVGPWRKYERDIDVPDFVNLCREVRRCTDTHVTMAIIGIAREPRFGNIFLNAPFGPARPCVESIRYRDWNWEIVDAGRKWIDDNRA